MIKKLLQPHVLTIFACLSLTLSVGWLLKTATAAAVAPLAPDCGTHVYDRCLNTGYFTGSSDQDTLFIYPFVDSYNYTDPCGYMPAISQWAFPVESCTTDNAHARDDTYTEAFIKLAHDRLIANCNTEGPFSLNPDSLCGQLRRNALGTAFMIGAMLGKKGSDFGTADWARPCGSNWWTDCYNPKMELGVAWALQNFDEWAKRVRLYNHNNQIRWNTFNCVPKNHMNSTGLNWGTDVQFFKNTDDGCTQMIQFVDEHGNIAGQINRICGNVLGIINLTEPHSSSNESYTTPGATTTFDEDENPTKATFTTSATIHGDAYNVNVIREYYIIRGGSTVHEPIPPADFDTGGPAASTITSTISATKDPLDTFSITNPVSKLSLQAGDRVCVRTTVDPPRIKVDFDGSTSTGTVTNLDADPPGSETTGDSGCKTIANKPYLSVYSGDVFAGGNFGTSGCTNTADIKGYLNGTGYGSGTQLAATALGVIDQFNSASLRGTAPPGVPATHGTGLDFANDGVFGGFGSGHCIKDYFAESVDFSGMPNLNTNGPSGVFEVTGNTTIGPGAIVLPRGRHIKLHIDGDLTITANSIAFSPAARSSTADIPSLEIVARNIKIASNVTRLDGVYVAQPHAGAGTTEGIINTCTDSAGAPIGDDNLYNDCGNQLVINGAFVANKVQFRRTLGSLRNAHLDNAFGAATNVCAGSSPGAPKSSCAGELFHFSPEVYLGVPFGSTPGTPTDPDDYQVVLPPVL